MCIRDRTASQLPDEQVEEEATLAHELGLRVAHRFLRRDRRYVQTGPAVHEELPQLEKVTVAAEYLEFALAVPAKHSVDHVVRALGLLRITHLPVADVLELDKAPFNAELAIVLVEHLAARE